MAEFLGNEGYNPSQDQNFADIIENNTPKPTPTPTPQPIPNNDINKINKQVNANMKSTGVPIVGIYYCHCWVF
ncbi:hypothetical protein ALNOE001_05250 [Candidatus Methanobinarius endosymbioticus]|uniref:Uncharacterized protein n=1 Tax=Candidatus Methanobinarius endosymbioticus TaxID=2006182 RepID=A0A366MCK8_9EURY|nr:hypothetical protein ALNOE001_05250 [Candidatus Methanobinarius endosymbioticus]